MTTVNLPFEEGTIAVPLPPRWQLMDTVRPVPHLKVPHVDGALIQSLDHPIGSTVPLRDKDLARKRIVVCVEDISRPSPTAQYFGPLLSYLLAHGAQRENVQVLFGLGVHRDMTAEEARHKL